MGVTSMALHVQKPLGNVEMANHTVSKFAVVKFEDGGYIHFSYWGEENVMEVIKDFCQTLIGVAEANEANQNANGS